MFEAERADEGRQDERGEEKGTKDFATGKAAAGKEERQRNGDEGGEERGEERDLEAVEDGEAVEAVVEEEAKEVEGERLLAVVIGVEKGAAEESEERVDQKAAKEKGEGEEEDVLHAGCGFRCFT
jgi:hypothetical protein